MAMDGFKSVTAPVVSAMFRAPTSSASSPSDHYQTSHCSAMSSLPLMSTGVHSLLKKDVLFCGTVQFLSRMAQKVHNEFFDKFFSVFVWHGPRRNWLDFFMVI